MDAIDLLKKDHDEVRGLFAQFRVREIEDVSGDETFTAKMQVLMEDVEHHADDEEEELFPELREKVDTTRLEELGGELEAAR